MLAVVGDVPCGRVLVAGELDMLTAPRLEQLLTKLLHAGYRQVGVDLSGVGFCAVAGLNVICSATGRYREAGGRLQVVALPWKVKHVLAITGLDRSLNLDQPATPQPETSAAARMNGAGPARGAATPDRTSPRYPAAEQRSPLSEPGLSRPQPVGD